MQVGEDMTGLKGLSAPLAFLDFLGGQDSAVLKVREDLQG